MKKISRRKVLGASFVGGVGLATSGCSRIVSRVSQSNREIEFSVPEHSVPEVVRVVNRTGFGPAPGEIARVEKVGVHNYVAEQLEAKLPEPLDLRVKLERLEIFGFQAEELRDLPENEVLRQLQQATILRAVYSRNQLMERMVDFWTNHFNIYGRKGFAAYRLGADSVEVIRKHALGNFRSLLGASATSPAMLAYLDNQLNKKGIPNENYARELLELHTLGVGADYTIKDVQEVARCFTGWTIERGFLKRRGTFVFDESQHDDGEKFFMGHQISRDGGVRDGNRVLDVVAFHPATVKRLATRLSEHFLGIAPEAIIESSITAYEKSRGDIRETLKPILYSSELQTAPPHIKRPFDYAVSALRALGAESDAGTGLQRHLEQMGQPLHQWPMPDGYPRIAQAWSGSMLARWNFALALCSNQIDGTVIPLTQISEKAKNTYEAVFGNSHVDAEDSRVDAESLAVELCSPSFQWR